MVSKKILMSAILAALGLSTFAFAGGEFAPAPAPVACDMGPAGFYVGGRVGYGNNYWNNIDHDLISITFPEFGTFTTERRTKHTGFAGGVEIGYAFNRYLAVEAGFMGLPRAKIDRKFLLNGAPVVIANLNPGFVTPGVAGLGLAGGFGNNGNDFFGERSINNYAFDISGKISILFPNSDNVGLFAKAGVGFLQSKHRNHHNDNGCGFGNLAFPTITLPAPFLYPFTLIDGAGGWGQRHNISNTNLTYGFGIFWNFTPNMTLDGRFQRWHGNPHTNLGSNFRGDGHRGYQPYMDAYTIGLTYHIEGSGDLFNT